MFCHALNLHENGAFPRDVPDAFAEHRRRHPMFDFGPSHPLARVMASKQVLQIADMRADSTLKKTRHLLRWCWARCRLRLIEI
jgi:hypothetical protein